MVVFSKSVQDLTGICQILKRGEVVAAPTETAYGLLADATNRRAVNKIFAIKGRRPDKPLPLAAADLKMVRAYTHLSPLAVKLARKFWPGPLTLVLSTHYDWPQGVVNQDRTVGFRVPGSLWLRRLVRLYGKPLTVTSANLAGQAVLYDMKQVKKSLSQRGLKYIVKCRLGQQRPTSTVLQVEQDRIKLLRSGAVPFNKLKSAAK